MHLRSLTHLKEESQYFYVSKDKDTRNYPRGCRHSLPLSTNPSQPAAYKEGVTALDRETIQLESGALKHSAAFKRDPTPM